MNNTGIAITIEAIFLSIAACSKDSHKYPLCNPADSFEYGGHNPLVRLCRYENGKSLLPLQGVVYSVEPFECPQDAEKKEMVKDDMTMIWCEDSNGKKNGPFRNYYSEGQIATDGQYRNGEAWGEIRNWRVDGSLEREIRCIDDNTCFEYIYNQCGLIYHAVSLRNGNHYGMEIKWNEYGIPSILHWKGALHGPWLEATDSGARISTGFFYRGKQQGPAIEWSPTGCPMETTCEKADTQCHICNGEYQEGKRVGIWSEWSPNGSRKLAIFEYEDGKLVKEKKLD